MAEETFNPFQMARKQFDRAAAFLGLDEATRELLRTPMYEYHFTMPVRMDDETVRVFRGFRVRHNDAKGPSKGGVRFHPGLTIDTTRALAMWMTWRCAVLDLPLGGSMGGVACAPHELSAREEERICRQWVRRLSRDIGPNIDIPEPELSASEQHMLWMLDEYETVFRERLPAFITGKPVHMGGSLGRAEATGYGLVFTVREALKELGLKAEETSASFQGFGKTARHAIRLYQRMGGTVASVSCWDHEDQSAYAFTKKEGIDLDELLGIADEYGGIDENKARDCGYAVMPGDTWLEGEVDILVPAALENQITKENVGEVRPSVKILAEGASGPTTLEADRVLAERGVFVIPDFLANAGGVTASYFEQVQSNMNYYWERDEVLGNLDVKMTSAFRAVSRLAKNKELSMRDAAYYIAVDRVAEACRRRGWV